MLSPHQIPCKKILKPLVFSSLFILSIFAHAEKPSFPDISLPVQAQGQKAIHLLGDKLPDLAKAYNMTTAQFARTLREDRSAWIDKKGRLFYIDNEAVSTGDETPTAEATVAYSNTFKLHSKVGSKRVIYLDFTGFLTSGKAWASGATIDSPAFSLDADRAMFSHNEMDIIQEVWKRVAEDYAPFDVDITTEDPGQDAITRSSSADEKYGTRAVITTLDSRLCTSCGGVAYVGIYDYVGDYYNPAFVFYDKLGSNAKNIAEATSHEVGHNLGLSHDGTSTSGYYTGQGSGATSWAPIMGVGYYKQLSQWSKGEYNDARQSQDDVVIIQSNGVLLVSDDHTDALNTTATPLALSISDASNTENISGSGIISTPTDSDVFSFISGTGDITINVAPNNLGTNLDIEASLYDSADNLITSSNPSDTTVAFINAMDQAAGTYYLRVKGVGKGDPFVNGYSDYGSLGQFTVSGYVATSPFKAPTAIISPLSSQTYTPSNEVHFNALESSDVDGHIVNYHWSFGDNTSSSELTPSHTFKVAGDYIVKLTVTDNDGLVGTSSTSIKVTSPTPTAPSALTADLNISGKGKHKTVSLTLNWIDNANNEDYFVIERCPEIGRKKFKTCTFSNLTTLPANALSFTESPTAGTFKYKVKAVNNFGTSTSNEIKVNLR